MNSIAKTKLKLGLLTTSLFIVCSYEIRSIHTIHSLSAPVIVILSFLLSSYCSNWIVSLLLSLKYGRMLILKRAWIEGFWLLQTIGDKDDKSPLLDPGILDISYNGPGLELNVIAYRINWDHKLINYAKSEMTWLRENDRLYFNYFSITRKTKESQGIAIGKFFKEGSRLTPNQYDGKAILFDEGIYRKQIARKLTRKEINEAKKKDINNWKLHILHSKNEITKAGNENWRNSNLEQAQDENA